MRTFSDNFQQGGKYSVQIASHQGELRREENFIDQKSLSTSYLQIEYFNLENYVINDEKGKISQSSFSHCGGSRPTGNFPNQ